MESPATSTKREIASKELLIAVPVIVAMGMAVRYVVGALLWLDGHAGAYLFSLAAAILGLAFLAIRIKALRRLKLEVQAQRRSGEPRRPYSSRNAILLVTAMYCTVAAGVALAVDLAGHPSTAQRDTLAGKIFATPPWEGSLVKN